MNQKLIPPKWENSLQNYYEKKFFPNIYDKVSGEARFSNYRSVSQAAKYLQYYYIVANSYPLERKPQLLDAGESTAYTLVSKSNSEHRLYKSITNRWQYRRYHLFSL
ncbi:MAG: hypothetical protein RMY28_023310 [Nostoc sp. ChiSLP01]|nr:hypothetical protein [Nostoc sp. CmiSLP01]MDZ8288550.1 hypothetical protein [Nostoc sp. ChiSLP01]